MLPNDKHFEELRHTRGPRRSVQPTTTPNSPAIHVHMPEYPRIFVDSLTSNIPVTAASRGVERGQGIDRQYAVYLDSDSDDDDVDTFNLEAILQRLTTRYQDTDFRKYEQVLRSNGINYLNVAAQFPISWYTDPAKTGMTEGEAALFREWVVKEVVKREKTRQKDKENRKLKGKKRVRVSSAEDTEGVENIPPVASCSGGG